MQSVLSFAWIVYLVFYVFEGLIRYGFHLAGKDALIFIRDGVLMAPLALLFVQQFLRRQVHPAFIIFFFVILLHGLVMLLNIGSLMAVAYSAKMLVTIVAGALLADRLFKPGRFMLAIVLLLWAVSWAGIMLDKYYVDFPWTGLETTIDDVKVEISRDWQISGEDKRAGGFMRSSINAATIEPLLALILMFHLRSRMLRLLVALLTVPALYWTTQKGPLLAFLLTLGILAVSFRKSIPLMRLGVLTMLMLAVILPIALSGISMPQAEGVFSFSSFYQRMDQMWPSAWRWIANHNAFPFGVGLGGISGAQRLYRPIYEMNAADNMFILMYAYFGVMSFIYLGFIGLAVLRTPGNASAGAAQAMATLMFLISYGCVISLLEDQMASLFLGGAVVWLCRETQWSREQEIPKIASPRTALVRA